MEKEEITIAEIDRLAGLSGFEFSAKEKQALVGEVRDVIEMISGCARVSTAEDYGTNSCGINDLREDEVGVSLKNDVALMGTSKTKDGYFVVPKVVE